MSIYRYYRIGIRVRSRRNWVVDPASSRRETQEEHVAQISKAISTPFRRYKLAITEQ